MLPISLPANTKIRVHKAVLLRHPCAKLWYLCRALDTKGQGFVLVKPEQWGFLGSKPTIYRWLREGRRLGFFRSSSWSGETLRICLGGLLTVCRKAGITNWGATADDYLLSELLQGNGRRRIASAIATQDLQARSHFAAIRQLSTLDSKSFKILTAYELLTAQTSLKMACGGTSGLVHIGEQRIFVGRSFIPFGVSQEYICEVLNSQPHSCGVSSRTLRRHLDQLGITKRQLMQAKPEYGEIYQQLGKGIIKQTVGDISSSPTERGGIIRLDEPNGKSGSRREGGHIVDVKRFSRYFGATWLYRCNLYSISYTLTSMKAKRREWKRLAAAKPVENSRAALTPQTPQEEEMPKALEEGSALGNQNKADKNDNAQSVEPEQVSEIPTAWEEMKQKLYQQRQQRQSAKHKSLETSSLQAVQDYWKQQLSLS